MDLMWQLVFTDNNFVPQGEILNAGSKAFTFGLKKLPVCSFQIRTDNAYASQLYKGQGFIKAYKNSVLEFFGPIVGREEVVDRNNSSLVINAAGAAWFFTKRLVGKSRDGTRFTTLTDRALIAQRLIDEANTLSQMPVRALPANATSGSTTVYETGTYTQLAQCISELSDPLGGFDWEVRPIEPTQFNRTGVIGDFFAVPLLGQNRPEAIYEFGTGKHSIVSYKSQLSRDVQANTLHHVGEGNQAPKTKTDAATVADYWMLEDTINASISDEQMRIDLLQEHFNVRKNPRQVITFEPHIVDRSTPGRVPDFLTDYRIGDRIRGRAVTENVHRFDALFRVYGAQVNVDDKGVEAVGLVLVDE